MEKERDLFDCTLGDLVRLDHDGAYYFAFVASDGVGSDRPNGYVLLADIPRFHRARSNITALVYKHLLDMGIVDVADYPKDIPLQPGSVGMHISFDPPLAKQYLIVAGDDGALLSYSPSEGTVQPIPAILKMPVLSWHIHLDGGGIPYVDPNYIFDVTEGTGREVDR